MAKKAKPEAKTPIEAVNEKDLDGTKRGQAARWQKEFKAARERQAFKDFQLRGKEVMQVFLDRRDDAREGWEAGATHVNLFTSNVQTMRCIMFGKTPRVDVSRRFADSSDDVARVSAEILERILNADIQRDGDTYADAVGCALDDRLLPGLGVARVRYVAELEDVEPEPGDLEEAPAPPPESDSPEGAPGEAEGATEVEGQPEPEQSKSYECVETDYVHWRDFLWPFARTWAQVQWVAFGTYLSRAEAAAQFGDDVAGKLPFSTGKKDKGGDTNETDLDKRSAWAQARIWEVWSKEDRKRYFFCEGFGEVLVPKGQDALEDGGVEDPLGLEGFFPCPKPLFANLTSDDVVPVPDYYLAQDLFRELNLVSTRITVLERAISVRGAYDKSNAGLQELLTETNNLTNALIPVPGLKMAQGNDIAKSIVWLPVDMVVAALDKLRDYRSEIISLINQATGMSDIVRGQAAQQTTATEQSIKARFASVRIQAMQDEFARFCTDLQRLKAEVISKHFDAATIVEQANMLYTPDAVAQMQAKTQPAPQPGMPPGMPPPQQPDLIEQAVALIKSNHYSYRVEVKPESVSLTDYAALKSESMEVLQAIGGYLQMAAPLGMQAPQLGPMLLQLLQWSVSRIRGSQEIEGLLDRAISQMQAAQQATASAPPAPPKPDPKVVATQMKAQADAAHTQQELHADVVRSQVETQASRQQEMDKARIGVMADAAKSRQQVVAGIDRAINPPGTGGV